MALSVQVTGGLLDAVAVAESHFVLGVVISDSSLLRRDVWLLFSSCFQVFWGWAVVSCLGVVFSNSSLLLWDL